MTYTAIKPICTYCKKPLDEDGRWFQCNEGCGVCYVYQDDGSLHIKFEREIGDWAIALNLYPVQNKTVLTAFHTTYGLQSDNVDEDKGRTHIEIPHCMRDVVTPENCLDKIKLILMFS